MKVLSLFDGISCGRVAFDKLGIPVDRYVAYEIEKSAIAIAKGNYDTTEERGDVFKADFNEFKGFDTLIGGSPCTYWSIAQKPGRREVTNSGIGWDLFSQYIRALKESEAPYFLYENNYSMDKNIRKEITKAFTEIMQDRLKNCDKNSEQYKAAMNYNGVIEPIYINSELLTAQHRSRLYWTNIPFKCQPTDAGIKLQDIIENGYADRNKALCVTRRYAGFSGTQSLLCRRYFGKSFGQAIFASKEDRDKIYQMWKQNPRFDESNLDHRLIRQMTPLEVERCQGLPDNYTNIEGVSKYQRIEAVGNGWSVPVIVHLLSGLLGKPKEADIVQQFKFG